MTRELLFLSTGAALSALFLAPLALSGEPHTAPLVPPAEWTAPTSLAPLVEAVQPAVLSIEVEGAQQAMGEVPEMFRQFFDQMPQQPRHGEGSGFIISRDGLVLTNYHVIDGASEIHARLTDGSRVEAKVLGSDPRIDVALLQLQGDRTWPHLALGDSEATRVGDPVMAAGNPLGLGHTVTSGIISGKGRALGHDGFDDFLQTDAAINPGNSGGPLFNMRGEVVGINTAIVQGANTVGFAIPINLVQRSLDDLRTLGRVSRGFLGVLHQPVDGPLAAHCGVEQLAGGSLVEGVLQGSPAEAAGLVPCDVVVEVNGERVDDPDDLVKRIGMRHPGDEVELELVRKGRKHRLHVTLAESPERPGEALRTAPTPSAEEVMGLRLAPLSGEELTHQGLSHGVRVEGVSPGSPARRALRPDDVLVEVGGAPVATPEEVRRALARAAKDGDEVWVSVVRARTLRLVPVPVR
ncbi:MAG: Do family serine endopeptidase [Deltaproteobacteria bacterium]|nr:Do family serine endopeptidase [Deltaproteobacteria bacterium]